MERETKLDIIEIARGYVGAILLAILMFTGVVSAYYAGESITFENEMGIENLVYTIIGNSSPVGLLDIQINSTNITITFPGDMIPDSFDIIFLEEQTKEVIKTIYRNSGSSGGSTRYVDRNVTVYVPEYINTTEIIEVEKIVDNSETIVVEKDKSLWVWIIETIGLIFAMLITIGIGVIFGRSIINRKRKQKLEEESESRGGER